jgi:C4-type Zn-finger protein
MTDNRDPIDAKILYSQRLEGRITSVEGFVRAVRHAVESEDWSAASQSVQALVSSSVQVVEYIATLYMISCMERGHYKTPRKIVRKEKKS